MTSSSPDSTPAPGSGSAPESAAAPRKAGRRSSPQLPEAPLTSLIKDGRSRKITQPQFARSFAATRMLLLSGSEPTEEEAEPLVLELPSGEPAVAVFASPDYVDDDYLAAAAHPLPMDGAELLRMLPTGVGLALNPGQRHSLVLEPGEIPSFAFVALSPELPENTAALGKQKG